MQNFVQPRSLIFIGLALVMLGTACLPVIVTAQPNFDINVGLPGGSDDTQKKVLAQQRIGNLIITAINFMLGLAAVLALGAIIWGGIVMVTSAGNEKRVESAKKTITWAIIGLLVIGFSFLIVIFIGQTLGAVAPKAGNQNIQNK